MPGRTAPNKATTTDTDDPADTSASTDDDGPRTPAYLNTTPGLLIYDKDGHSVAGGEWVEIPGALDAVGKQAREAGYLLPRSAVQ